MDAARRLTRPGGLLVALALLVGGCAAPSSRDDGADDGLNAEAAAEQGAEAWRDENYDEAMNLLQQAALQGNARAQYAVGYMYYNGQGVERDADKALPWFRRAAEQGDQKAREALSIISQGISRQKLRNPNGDAKERDGGSSDKAGDQDSDSGSSSEATDNQTNDKAGNGDPQTRVPDDS
jgi:TPR repeat protein